MNQVILIGRLTKNPELNETQSGKSVATFNLAVDKYGDGADFINCVVWGKSAENLVKYQTKGSQVAVNGRISTRTYEDAKGNKQYITEVVADSIEFLGNKKENEKETNPFEEFGNNIKSEGNGIEIKPEDLPF